MLSAAVPAATADNTYVVVSPAQMHGWVWWDDNTDTPNGTGQMVFGPGDPPLGVGSAQIAVTVLNDRQALLTGAYKGTPLADISYLHYWTYTTQPTHALAFQFDVQYQSADLGYQGRLIFEPGYYTNGTIQPGWQEWSPLSGRWWASKAPGTNPPLGLPCGQATPGCSWGQIRTMWPYALIRGAVLFKAGGNWEPWQGNVDAFTIGVKDQFTTYDFEPTAGCHEGDGTGDFQGNNGKANFNFDGDGCLDGDKNSVSSSNRGDGRAFQSTSISSVAMNSLGNTMKITGAGTVAGVPVTFVLLAVESTPLTPSWVSLTFSDGYSNAGNLLNGSVLLH
jgi:hypothetical protein